MQKNRLVDIDFYKGIAIFLVVFYHFIFDLCLLKLAPIDPLALPWIAIGRIAASTFILLAGTVFATSFLVMDTRKFIVRVLQRSLKLLAFATIITLSFYTFEQRWSVLFGILHFLAVAPLCASIFIFFKRKWLFLVLALGIFLFTPMVTEIEVDHLWLITFGIIPNNIPFSDYFPFFPWLGIYFSGVFLGLALYKPNARALFGYTPSNHRITRFLTLCGKYTLTIYLLHQPILLAILYLYNALYKVL